MSNEIQRCGYVALLGRPNVGKSTLLNHVLRQKLAITSRKPQTTRHNLLGIDTEDNNQVLYIDTPGLHGHEGRALNKYMVAEAQSVLSDVDLRVVLIEAGRTVDLDNFVIRMIEKVKGPSLAVLSKVDLLKDKTELLPQMEQLAALNVFSEIIPMSALKNDGIDVFRQQVFSMLPEAPHLYDPEQLTDKSERHLVAEIIDQTAGFHLAHTCHACSYFAIGLGHADPGAFGRKPGRQQACWYFHAAAGRTLQDGLQ